MYQLKYDFQQYNQAIGVYLEVLINKSTAMFQNQIRNGQIENSAKYLSELTNITSQMRDWREPFVNTNVGEER